MNSIERNELIQKVSHLLGCGLHQLEISQILEISQQRVSYYRKCLREEFYNKNNVVYEWFT